jgi:hypothetical protein
MIRWQMSGMVTRSESRVLEEEARTIETIVKAHPWPAAIKGYEVAFGVDSTGDPAVRIWLDVDDDLDPPEAKIKELGRFRRGIETTLLEAGLSHWPYVSYRALQPAGLGRAD